jgi:pyrimidine-nucleoside phosphorylase
MDIIQILKTKELGMAHPEAEIKFIVDGFANGKIPDYQLSAWLMAVFLKGMNSKETSLLTKHMVESSEIVDLSGIDGIVSDKHSTGGVGDKTSMALVPLVAAAGGKVAKMSGRGLGHTGGTIDKLESIPGFRVEMDLKQFIEQINRIGCAIIGASKNLVPVDKKMYALRDVTATVGSIPLMAASIISKKLASGSQAIVLDVKCGSGAFMKNLTEARELARIMIEIARNNGRVAAAYITNMDVPLGHNVGNALEVVEVIETLKGQGPEDLQNECIEIGARMLELSRHGTEAETRNRIEKVLADGSALRKFRELITAQGGDADVIDDYSKLIKEPYRLEVKANKSGYIQRMDTEGIGLIAVDLGAGRKELTDVLDYQAGINITQTTGDAVQSGETLATLFSNSEKLLEPAAKKYLDAITVSENRVETKPRLVYDFLR